MKKFCIVVVDDNPNVLKLISANLRERGFEAIGIRDSQTALRQIEQTLPDLVILDLLMSGMDGFKMCRRIREWSNLPIIILAAEDDSKSKSELLTLGADDYITKPFNIEELMERVYVHI